MELKILQLIGFGVGGIIVAIICNTLFLSFSHSLGIRNKNDVTVRWSNQSKPSLGGISFYLVFIFATMAYSIVFNDEPNILHNRQFVGLLSASTLAFLMGLADDAYNTKPFLKLFVQIFCGVILVTTGTIIDVFHNFGADSIVTVVWVIIVMNSLNMLDNMDGITGSTVFFILASTIAANWLFYGFNTNVWSIMMISVIGAVIGFLTMNVNPAKLFMGDAGSQFIGLYVAFFAIDNLWNVSTIQNTHSWLGACVVLVAFTPAAVDTLTVVINRIRKGKSPMVGGKDHTTHHLVYSGYTDRGVWYIFLIIGLLSTVLTISMVNLIILEAIVPVVFFLAYFVFVFLILYRNTLKYPEPKK